MSGLIIIIASIVVFAIFDLLAQSHGVDSRDGFEDASAPACGLSV
jgi:hypothetical protein